VIADVAVIKEFMHAADAAILRRAQRRMHEFLDHGMVGR
jgi:hypothetical protein